MKKHLILVSMIFSLFHIGSAVCQGIRGGEFYISGSLVVTAYIYLYTQTEPRLTIHFDWGDGTIELVNGASNPVTNDIIINTYVTEHTYQTAGNYRVGLLDSFIIDNISNIVNSGEKYFELYDSLFIPSSPTWYNEPPNFFSLQNELIQLDNGTVIHPTYIDDFDWHDSLKLELVPFTTTDYTFPMATDTILCNLMDCLVWDKPLGTGIFAFGIKITEYSHGIKKGTTTRKMVIELDSLVSSTEGLDKKKGGTFSISPNPIEGFMNCNFPAFGDDAKTVLLMVHNIYGQCIYQEEIESRAGGTQASINTQNWPKGQFIVTVHADGKSWAKKIIIL